MRLMLPLQRAWVRSLVGELRFCMLHSHSENKIKVYLLKKKKLCGKQISLGLKKAVRASLGAQRLSLLVVQETWVPSLVQEDPTGLRAPKPMSHKY